LTPLAAPLQIGLVILVVAAAVFDVRERRIPNWLTASGLVAGILINVVGSGWQGLKLAALGLGLAFLIYFALFALRAAGGGDVKLMAAIGSFSGPSNWLVIFVFASVLGGIAAIVLALVKGRLRQTLRNVIRIVRELASGRPPYARHPDLDVANPGALRLPYGAVIAAGTFAYLLAIRAK
jgi:prepilin peptidase CpaA